MAYLAFTVPLEPAKKLASLYSEGDLTAPSGMHVTVCFLSKNTPPATVMKAIAACYSVARDTAPILMHAALLTSFPPNPEYREGVPVIARIVSDNLQIFQDRILASLDKFGVEYSRLHPEYKPHVTLSHGPKRVTPKKIDPISWTSSHLMIWGGEEHYEGIFAGIELSG